MLKQSYIGQKFGKWTVLRKSQRENCGNHALYVCRCECGKERDVFIDNLKSGRSKSCRSCSRYDKFNKKKYMGVNLHKTTGRWRSVISVNGTVFDLGYYKTQKEALAVRNGFIIVNKLNLKTQEYRGEL